MCAGALVHVRMKRVIFGCMSAKDGAAGGVMNLLQHPALNHSCEITGGVRQEDCAKMLQAFFRERRTEAKSKGLSEKSADSSGEMDF